MKYKISKELFEAVFNEELANIEIGKNSIVAYIIDGTEFTEDINDFFFKCKEWALKQGYFLYSISNKNEGFCFINLHSTGYDKHIISDSEQQAVFDACTHILTLKEQ